MSNRKDNSIPEELRVSWLTNKNSELGLDFDKLKKGSNKKAYWLINGVEKYVMIKSVVNNRKTKPNPIPECYKENWLVEKNTEIGLRFEELTKSSHKEAWWTFKGKEQMLSIDSAIRNNPKNGKNKIDKKYLEFWVDEMNAELGLSFDDMRKSSTKEAYWYYENKIIKLKISQALSSKIRTRLKNKLKLHPKGNYIPERYYAEWYSLLNDYSGIKFDDLTSKNSKKAHWKCERHISYYQTVSSHTSGAGCPYCSGSIAHPFDSIWSDVELNKQWSLENDLKSYEVTLKSSKTFKWIKLETGEIYEQIVYNRYIGQIARGYSGKSLPRELSLGMKKTEWLLEWDYEKNNELQIDPFKIGSKSSIRAYWKCLENEEHPSYLRSPNTKSNIKSYSKQCPICRHELEKKNFFKKRLKE